MSGRKCYRNLVLVYEFWKALDSVVSEVLWCRMRRTAEVYARQILKWRHFAGNVEGTIKHVQSHKQEAIQGRHASGNLINSFIN
jgi:hypothetical protein